MRIKGWRILFEACKARSRGLVGGVDGIGIGGWGIDTTSPLALKRVHRAISSLPSLPSPPRPPSKIKISRFKKGLY